MPDSASLEALLAARRALRELPGWTVRAELASLDRSLHVFVGNAGDLRRLLGKAQEPTFTPELWDLKNRDLFDRFLDEVDRRLHNFVAGAMSLKEHTRRVARLLDGSAEAAAEYQRRVDDVFAASPLARFVQDLRNYTLHHGLAIATGHLEWSQDAPINSRIVLHPEELLKWERWTAPARSYIQREEDDIEIGAVASDYQSLVVGFHEWFREAVLATQRESLDELRVAEVAIAESFRGAFGPPPEGEAV